MMTKLDEVSSERDSLLRQNDRVRHLLLKLKRMQFGAKSERLLEEQLQVSLEPLEQEIARNEAEAEKHDPEKHKEVRARRRASRGASPAHLPRIDVTLAPEDTNCSCCRAPMIAIGEGTSQRLDVVPIKYQLIVTHRPNSPAGPARALWCRCLPRRG